MQKNVPKDNRLDLQGSRLTERIGQEVEKASSNPDPTRHMFMSCNWDTYNVNKQRSLSVPRSSRQWGIAVVSVHVNSKMSTGWNRVCAGVCARSSLSRAQTSANKTGLKARAQFFCRASTLHRYSSVTFNGWGVWLTQSHCRLSSWSERWTLPFTC